MVATLAIAFAACATTEDTYLQTDRLPTPDRSQVIIADSTAPIDVTHPEAVAAFQQAYDHMRDAGQRRPLPA